MCGLEVTAPPPRLRRSPPWTPTASTPIRTPDGRTIGSGTSTYWSTSGPPVVEYAAAFIGRTLRRPTRGQEQPAEVGGLGAQRRGRGRFGGEDRRPLDRTPRCGVVAIPRQDVGVEVRHPIAESEEIELDRGEDGSDGAGDVEYVVPVAG